MSETMGKEFEIRTYGIGELARLYRPDVSPESALRWLWRAIACRSGLPEELKRLGHRKGNHLLTPAQVEAIIKGIGGP